MFPNRPSSLRYSQFLDPLYFDNGLTFLTRNRLTINQIHFIITEVEKLGIKPDLVPHLNELAHRELRGNFPRRKFMYFKCDM